jgi:hypothetical protein
VGSYRFKLTFKFYTSVSSKNRAWNRRDWHPKGLKLRALPQKRFSLPDIYGVFAFIDLKFP